MLQHTLDYLNSQNYFLECHRAALVPCKIALFPMVTLCFGINFVQVPFWVAEDTDWVGCSVTLAGSNFDTSRFAAAIELDGMVHESFPFGDGRELFNPCKATDPVIEN